MAIPKGLEPTGVILVDKPAGPSSFAVLAGVRARERGRRPGMQGRSIPSRRASCFCCPVGQLQWRHALSGYRSATSPMSISPCGRPRATRRENRSSRTTRPRPADLEAALEGLRGEVELPIPTASAVKIGGERAYNLHRRGIVGRDALAPVAGRRARRHRVYRGHRDARSACQLRDLRPIDCRCARWPLRGVCGERKSGRSPSTRQTPSGSSISRRPSGVSGSPSPRRRPSGGRSR